MIHSRHSSAPPGLWVGQPWNVACTAALLVVAWVAWSGLGRPHPLTFWTAVAIPVGHQRFVWLCWRLELRSSAISRTIGFRAYLGVFFLLLIGRLVSILVLATIDRGSLELPVIPKVVTTLILSLGWVYAGHSVGRHFGFVRAAGADHFDARYRTMPLVREGIFRITRNGMYVFGFLIFWAIGIGFGSTAALVVAAFNHAYIWVHYHTTEKPDMDYLHGHRMAAKSCYNR